MMNPNEKRVSRIGWVLLSVAVLAVAPLAWSATRPVVAPPQAEPVWELVTGPVAVVATEAAKPVPEKKEAPKAKPAQAKAKPRAPWRCEREDLVQGTAGSWVVYCHS
jgi:hypothetical protein